MVSTHIKVLPASYGDSILLTLFDNQKNENYNILIDGGVGWNSYKYLKNEILSIAKRGEFIDLLVLTHIDEDHISGIIDILRDIEVEQRLFKEIWFNSGKNIARFFGDDWDRRRDYHVTMLDDNKMSIKQGATFESLIERLPGWKNELYYFKNDQVINKFGSEIQILSPNIDGLRMLNKEWSYEKNVTTTMSANCKSDYDKPLDVLIKNESLSKDRSIPNLSSIAFLLSYQGKKLLLMGDSTPDTIINSLTELGYSENNKLHVDVMKVAHHGSKRNTTISLLSLIECEKFIISTDGSAHCLPNKECLARIISSQPRSELIFNYRISGIFLKEDFKKFTFSCVYLDESEFTYIIGVDEP